MCGPLEQIIEDLLIFSQQEVNLIDYDQVRGLQSSLKQVLDHFEVAFLGEENWVCIKDIPKCFIYIFRTSQTH